MDHYVDGCQDRIVPGTIASMAKFLYSAAMSVDGFIAGPHGDMSWMTDHLGPNPVVDQLITKIGAILAGNRTLGGDDPYKGRDGEGERSVAAGAVRSSS